MLNPQNIILLTDRLAKNYKGLTYSYLKHFNSLGYNTSVIAFNTDERLYRYTKHFNILNRLYLEYLQRSIVQELKKKKVEFIFVIKGFYLLPKTIELIKEMGLKIICFNPDDPFSQITGSSNQNVKDCICLYDAYYIWSNKIREKLKNIGVENAFYLPFYPDSNIMKPDDKKESIQSIDVSFIGNGDKERNQFLNQLGSSIGSLKYTSLVYGLGWNKVHGFNVKGQVYNNEFLSTIYKSKINLNILRNQNKGAHNMRTFDIPACAGFMLHEYSDEVVGFFKPGKEIDTFNSVEECSDKIQYYLKNESIREKLALNGYNKLITAKYNYESNINSILDSLKINNL